MLFKRTVLNICKRTKRRTVSYIIAILSVLLILRCIINILPPASVNNEEYLHHFRRNRSLEHYLNNIEEKTNPFKPCGNQGSVPVVVLVSSASSNERQRDIIRSTWGRYQPTFFVLGMNESNPSIHFMTKTMFEFKMFDDLIIYSFPDHYQNLTLKTALMMQWTLQRCPQAKFMLKIDDDVLLIPWRLTDIIAASENQSLVGDKIKNAPAHRDPYNKYYLPRWLHYEDYIPEYLNGNAYLINMRHLKQIFEAAKKVPLINLEDVYFTSLVASRTLGLNLTHDKRFSPIRPMYPVQCVYWNLATIHGVRLEVMPRVWDMLENYNEDVQKNVSFAFVQKICPLLT